MKGFEGIGFEVAPSRLMRTGQIVTGDILSDENISSSLARNVLLLRTLLKPGGRLYLTLPDSSSWVARITGEKWNICCCWNISGISSGYAPTILCPLRIDSVGGGALLTWSISLRSFCEPHRHMVTRFRRPSKFIVKLPVGLMFVMASRGEG